jgi:hypothetical protein
MAIPSPMDAPIPGENYTSDTKNYAWHRPPEHTDMDAAIEASFKKLTEDENASGLLTMLEMGATVAELTQTFVISGIGAGKWTPDFALLMAGPISNIIYLMAKGFDIDCDMGLEKKNKAPTTAFFKAAQKDKEKIKEVAEDIGLDQTDLGEGPSGGFMGMKNKEQTELTVEE